MDGFCEIARIKTLQEKSRRIDGGTVIMGNVLNQQPDYVISQNALGVPRKYLYEGGMLFREFTSHWRLGVLPIVHITMGINPETGKRLWARGVIAVGRKAVGIIAIGQVAAGIISIGQLSLAIVFALGQLSIAGIFSAGQAAVSPIAIGQFAAGIYVLAQIGMGKYVLSMKTQDYEAICFFKTLWLWCKNLI